MKFFSLGSLWQNCCFYDLVDVIFDCWSVVLSTCVPSSSPTLYIACSCKLEPKLYIPSTINNEKELLRTVIWADKEWTVGTSSNPKSLRIITI